MPIQTDFLDDRYTFDPAALRAWVDEGISINTMFYYRITYDPINNCIIIPQYDEDGKQTCQGFECTGQILALGAWMDSSDVISNYEGAKKYRRLLESKLVPDGSNVVTDTYSDIYLADGTKWIVTDAAPAGETFGADIVIDLKRNDTDACGIYSSSCKRPNKFSFHVDKFGKIVANDHLTQAYLDNSTKLNDKKADYAKALEAITAEEEALENAQE